MVERSGPDQTGLPVSVSAELWRALGIGTAAEHGGGKTGGDQEGRPGDDDKRSGRRGGRASAERRRWTVAPWRSGTGTAVGRAAGRWKLLGQQQCDLGGQKWRQARTSRRWTWAAEACVRWVAGWGGDQLGGWSGPLPSDPGCGTPQPTAEEFAAGGFTDISEKFLAALSLATETAQEAELHSRLVRSRAATVDAAMEELAGWAPGMFEDDMVRGLSCGTAHECRLRAELLVEEARASLEAMAEAAAVLRDSAGFATDLRLSCADAMTQVWRFRGDGCEEAEEGGLAVGDLAVAIVAGLAAAAGEMSSQARRELDRSGWQVFGGLRRVRQAQREERCAGRAHAMWLEDEAGWWAILAAAAAAATTADGRAGPAATSAGTNGASDRDGGGDDGGTGTGGDVTPQPGH